MILKKLISGASNEEKKEEKTPPKKTHVKPRTSKPRRTRKPVAQKSNSAVATTKTPQKTVLEEATQDHPDQRVGVFIDTSNLYHSAKALYQARMNFEVVLKDAVRNRKLIRAFSYVIRTEGQEEAKFFTALKDLGFEVREKDLKIFGSGMKKADWDIGIAMDIVRLVSKLDVVVLISGDGDFVELVKYAQAQGVRVEVMSFKRSTSAELIDEVDYFIDFDQNHRKYTFPK